MLEKRRNSMISIPDPQKAIELIKNNEEEIEIRFVKWAKSYHQRTGRFAEKKEAEEAIPEILVNYVFEKLGDPSLDLRMQTVTKKVLEKVLKSAGMFNLDIEVTATGGKIQAQIDLNGDQGNA